MAPADLLGELLFQGRDQTEAGQSRQHGCAQRLLSGLLRKFGVPILI